VAIALSKVKVAWPSCKDILREITALNLTGSAPKRPKEFADLYHERTWRELWNLRKTCRSYALTALTLGKLHGHSPGFFSSFTYNQISIRPKSLKRQRKKHGTKLEYRDVKENLKRAAKRFFPDESHRGDSFVRNCDARKMMMYRNSVDLIITSPPFLDVIDYVDVNWVREWFLNEPEPDIKTFAIRGKASYGTFLHDVFVEVARVLKPGGLAVFEVGPVSRERRMYDIVMKEAEGVLDLEEMLLNDFDTKELARSGKASVPKISRAMHGGKETVTMRNQCVVLKKP